MIVPNKFFHTNAATELGELLADRKCLKEIVDFGDSQVFHGPDKLLLYRLYVADSQQSVRYVSTKAGLLC